MRVGQLWLSNQKLISKEIWQKTWMGSSERVTFVYMIDESID